jgi:hypothetical protein
MPEEEHAGPASSCTPGVARSTLVTTHPTHRHILLRVGPRRRLRARPAALGHVSAASVAGPNAHPRPTVSAPGHPRARPWFPAAPFPMRRRGLPSWSSDLTRRAQVEVDPRPSHVETRLVARGPGGQRIGTRSERARGRGHDALGGSRHPRARRPGNGLFGARYPLKPVPGQSASHDRHGGLRQANVVERVGATRGTSVAARGSRRQTDPGVCRDGLTIEEVVRQVSRRSSQWPSKTSSSTQRSRRAATAAAWSVVSRDRARRPRDRAPGDRRPRRRRGGDRGVPAVAVAQILARPWSALHGALPPRLPWPSALRPARCARCVDPAVPAAALDEAPLDSRWTSSRSGSIDLPRTGPRTSSGLRRRPITGTELLPRSSAAWSARSASSTYGTPSSAIRPRA